jgi:SAM-dependent methyltransferase
MGGASYLDAGETRLRLFAVVLPILLVGIARGTWRCLNAGWRQVPGEGTASDSRLPRWVCLLPDCCWSCWLSMPFVETPIGRSTEGYREVVTNQLVVGFCPACSSTVSEWTPGPAGRPRAGCPSCGSLDRYRHLALVLVGLRPLLVTSSALLEASPEPQTKLVVSSIAPNVNYVRTDLTTRRWVDVAGDALALPFQDRSFDIVIHFHTFEHIPNDRAAMREVARILKPGGFMLCQVPRRAGQQTDEDLSLTSEQRQERYGQYNHVRVYGDDFEERLQESGFIVGSHAAGDVLDDSDLDRFNIPSGDRIWTCRPEHSTARANTLDELERELHSIRADLAATSRQYENLRSRKVVRAGLAVGALAKPVIRASRRLRTQTMDVDESAE